jgi:methionyl-tRNA synthetase
MRQNLPAFLPETAQKIFEQLQVTQPDNALCDLAFGTAASYTVGTPEPLFARVDVEKVLAELERKDSNAREG